MTEGSERAVFIAHVSFVRGPALDAASAPVTTIRIEGDKIAIGTGEYATRVPVANVKTITLTPMSLSEALAKMRPR